MAVLAAHATTDSEIRAFSAKFTTVWFPLGKPRTTADC